MRRKSLIAVAILVVAGSLLCPGVTFAASDTMIGATPTVNCSPPGCSVSGNVASATDGDPATYVTITASGSSTYSITYTVNQPYLAVRTAVTASGGNSPMVSLSATASCTTPPCGLGTGISPGLTQTDLSASSYGWQYFQTATIYLYPRGGTITLQLYEVAAYSTLSAPTVAPTGLTATGVASAVLSWNPVASGVVDWYQVYRDGSAWASSASNTWTDTNTGGKSHVYAVAACNAFGCGPVSAPVRWDGTPATPTGLAVRAYNSYAVSLTWTANTDNPAGYNIYRSGKLVLQLNAAAPAALDTGLTPEQTYQYSITAVSSGGLESAQSAPVSVTLPSAMTASPSPPTTATPSVTYAQPLRFSSPGNSGAELDIRAGATGFPVSASGNTITGKAGAVPGGYTVQILKAGAVIGSTVAAADGSFTVTATQAFAAGDQLGVLFTRGS